MAFKPIEGLNENMDSICSEGREELPLRSFVPVRTDSGVKGWLITYPPHQPLRGW